MNDIRAFFTAPQGPPFCPNFMNMTGNMLLMPTLYLTNSKIAKYPTAIKATELTSLEPLPSHLIALMILIVIPTFIFGVIFKGISYFDKEVRSQHREFRELHEKALKPETA